MNTVLNIFHKIFQTSDKHTALNSFSNCTQQYFYQIVKYE